MNEVLIGTIALMMVVAFLARSVTIKVMASIIVGLALMTLMGVFS